MCLGGAYFCRMVLKGLLFESTSIVSEIIPTTTNFLQNKFRYNCTYAAVSGVKLCRRTRVNNYFSPGELNVMETWIIDPFKFNVDTLPDDESYKKDLIDLKESRNMKMEFESMVFYNFWSIQLETYPKLAEKALAVLLPFSTTYLCEAGFSFLVYLKNKYRNRLETVENDLRIALSNRQPRYEKRVDMKRQEKSNK